jgi:hypothetical protein
LEREAASNGVTLNQLVLAKLAVGLGRLTDMVRGDASPEHGMAVQD